MKIYVTTDYAIRIIVYLAQCEPNLCSSVDAAKQLGFSYSYFNKVATLLRKAGFIESEQGMNGGYRLAKDARNITLYDIISTMQGEIWLHRCLEEGNGCNSNLIADKTQCPVHNIFESLQGQIITMLSSYSIHDICDMSKEKDIQTCWKMLELTPLIKG